MNNVVEFRWREPFLTKGQLAAHYGFSTKWVERQMRKGLPSRTIGGSRRYLLSETDVWLGVAVEQAA